MPISEVLSINEQLNTVWWKFYGIKRFFGFCLEKKKNSISSKKTWKIGILKFMCSYALLLKSWKQKDQAGQYGTARNYGTLQFLLKSTVSLYGMRFLCRYG